MVTAVIIIVSLKLLVSCRDIIFSPKRIRSSMGKIDNCLTTRIPFAALTIRATKTNIAMSRMDKAFLGSCIILTFFRMYFPMAEAKTIAIKSIEPAIIPVATKVMERAIGTRISRLGNPIICRKKATSVAKKGKRRMRIMVLAGTPTPTAY